MRYLFAIRGEPEFIRSDNGPEFASNTVKKWLKVSNVKTLFVVPGSPWENGYVESFNSKLRDELLNRELFLHIDELKYVANRWRMDYNHYWSHSSLDYMAPAAFAAKCLSKLWGEDMDLSSSKLEKPATVSSSSLRGEFDRSEDSNTCEQ